MSLTTTMGVKLGPIVLGTLFKHYLERNSVTRDSKARNELLFDEAFIIVKSFLEESTKHTVEELQQFSNTRIPSPPWVHCVRVLIPLSCCDEAAPLLLKALGGPEAVGGSKWWQVRGVRGVDAQWVAVKRDWREAERRRKQRQDDSELRRQGTVRGESETARRPSEAPSVGRNNTAGSLGRSGTLRDFGWSSASGGRSRFRRESAPDLRRAKTGTARPASAHGDTGVKARDTLKRPATSAGTRPGGATHLGAGTPQAATNDTLPQPTPTASATTSIPETASAPPEHEKPIQEGEEDGEAHYEPEMDDMRCMLYIHGGGYYFGSVDQQRYCIQRYARKMGGRVLAVNYRLAPQYPFPCALQDCLAAYLYLIRPPPGAEHLPVPPNMVIIAGDSAGGGMTLALLQIIRDVGLPAPAGGILISPWCDLTHSFPSVLTNTATDIIPPYGLSLHKPSTLWPPPSEELTAELRGRMTRRVREVVRRGKSKLGLGGESELDLAKLVNENSRKATETKSKWRSKSLGHESGRSWWRKSLGTKEEIGRDGKTARGNSFIPPVPGTKLAPTVDRGAVPDPLKSEPGQIGGSEPKEGKAVAPENVPLPLSRTTSPELVPANSKAPAEPTAPPSQPTQPESKPRSRAASVSSKKAPKRRTTVDPSQGAIELEIDGQMKTIRSQIQFYAQNHQLTHPLVSPALGYLGGLPPLFILASDKEVLRDEIVYIAHKAAHPDRYPVKPETKERLPSLKDIEQKGLPPTLVHLQVYDETCHVLPLFSFSTPAKYCYRAIALFCKHVTGHAIPSFPPTPMLHDDHLVRSPKAEQAYLAPEQGSTLGSRTPITPTSPVSPGTPTAQFPNSSRRLSFTSPISLNFPPSLLRRGTSRRASGSAGAEPTSAGAGPTSPTSPTRHDSDDIAGPRFHLDKNEPPTGVGTAGDPSVYNLQAIGQAGFESPFKDNMIRERVSTSGVLRPLEPEDQLAGCTMRLENIGVINASAVSRYLEGQKLWDAKFSGTIKSIAKMRVKNLELARKEGRKSMSVLHGALANGTARESQTQVGDGGSPSSSVTFLGSNTWSMSWALEGENPPPSSIVSRRDTTEARQLALCADRSPAEESKMSGNNLWTVVLDFLTQNPDRNAKPMDPLVVDSTSPSADSSNLNINVEPPTPSSPMPPTSPTLSKRRSSGFLRKFIRRESASETTNGAARRPLSLFIDSSRNSGLPVVDKS